jgi:dTDP-glucose pyrophosphorylase
LEAIRVIDLSSLQIALVVDGDNRLCGTVTDGDIRRGILKNISMESPVLQIMNQNPIYARLNDGLENILALMQLKELRHMPIVDESGCVVGVEILEDLVRMHEKENWVILMAGGEGNRLRPITEDCPKPLIKVGNKPILETILENFIEYGFRRFYISVHYKAEMVREYFRNGSRWGVEIRYLNEDRAMGTAGALSLIPEKPGQPILVMNGDLLTKINFQQLLDFHIENQSQATMCVREYDIQVPFGVVTMERHRLLSVEEKPIQRCFVSAGIYVLEPQILDLVPQDSYYDMPELFTKVIANGLEAAAFPIREYWLDIGRIDELERAKIEYVEVFK